MCATVLLSDIVVSTVAEGAPVAGERYRISCEVLFPDGITNPISVEWHDSDGRLSSGIGITIGSTLTSQGNITTFLEFSPFRTVHGGRFSCRAVIMSQAPPFNISRTAEIDLVVGGESRGTS